MSNGGGKKASREVAARAAARSTVWRGAGAKLWQRRRGAARRPAASLAAAAGDESRWSGMAALSAGRGVAAAHGGERGEMAGAGYRKERLPSKAFEQIGRLRFGMRELFIFLMFFFLLRPCLVTIFLDFANVALLLYVTNIVQLCITN